MSDTGKGAFPFKTTWVRNAQNLHKFLGWTNRQSSIEIGAVLSDWFFAGLVANQANGSGSISEFTISEAPISGSPSTVVANSSTITETVTETDSATIIATDIASFTETQTESDSYASVYYWTNTLTETQTESDSAIIVATDKGLDNESNTASDAISGAATGLTNLNETGTVTDTHQGIASGLGLFTENNSLSDAYSSTQTQPGQNTVTETVTETDSATISAIDLITISELVAANDNYDCQQISPQPPGGITPAQTGPGDDDTRRRKYLDWVKRQKKRKKAVIVSKLEKNRNRYTEKVVELPKPEIKTEAKPTYIPSEQAARKAAIDTILSLIPVPLSPIITEAPYFELLELINALKEEEDEDAFMMLM